MNHSFQKNHELSINEYILFNTCSKIELIELHGIFLISAEIDEKTIAHLYKLYDFYTEINIYQSDGFKVKAYHSTDLPDYFVNSLALIDFF